MLLFLDLETTGLDPRKDHILEVAWQVTDRSLNAFSELESFVATISQETWSKLAAAPPLVQQMHESTGLLADLNSEGTLQLEDIEDRILDDLGSTHDTFPFLLAGMGVHFDQKFINEWMPRLSERLHYRIYDTRTLSDFFWELGVDHGITNLGEHRAKHDVVFALEIARSLRRQAADVFESATV